MESTTRLAERHAMVQDQLQKRGIQNPWVLQAMLDIPRHFFVPEDYHLKAYEDRPLPLAYGQTISQPYIVASMIELIEPKITDRVLEVGVGSGYSIAVLSRVVGAAYGVEKNETLLKEAGQKLLALDLPKIQLKRGDGTLGWPEEAPFDAILVTAGSPKIPAALLSQLKVGGVMVLPVGGRDEQKLIRIVKGEGAHFQEKELYPVKFVPLVGQEGWPENSL